MCKELNPTSQVSAQPASANQWPVLTLPGLHLDSLGNYLAALGLLRLASHQWPAVRGCWHEDQFVLVNGPTKLTLLEDLLQELAEKGGWSQYKKPWDKTQKADTKAQTAQQTSRWCALQASEEELAVFYTHLALGERLSFNVLFGTGGNSGKRDFTKGWAKAVAAVRKPSREWSRDHLNADLRAFLVGEPCRCLADFNAACWFSSANKAFNSGTQKPFREGQVTPWAMILTCEAFPLLQGSASRRLGQRKKVGAFPFVTTAAAPEAIGEAGRSTGEVWLPVWNRPMTVGEVAMLFSRGRAEVSGRGATSAPAFSAAIIQRGVDAGIVEFRRFVLLRTTSENTFESRLGSVVRVGEEAHQAVAEGVNVALKLRDSLPPDRKQRQRWIYTGLRGPLDRALIEVAANPTQENSWALVDAISCVLRKVDQNRNHRARNVRFQLLPSQWLAGLLEREPLVPEIRLALAIASLSATGATGPLLTYWLGAVGGPLYWRIPEAVPFRRVWAGANLTDNLVSVLERRLIEEKNPSASPPFSGRLLARHDDLALWLDRNLDEEIMARWINRFSLFAWGKQPTDSCRERLCGGHSSVPITSSLAFYALFKPLFNAELLHKLSVTRPAKTAPLMRIAALLQRGDLRAAAEIARGVYRSHGVQMADFDFASFSCEAEPMARRLLGALLIPVQSGGVLNIFHRWQTPIKTNLENK